MLLFSLIVTVVNRKIDIENDNPRQIPSPCGRGLRGGVTKLVIKHPHPNPLPSRERELFGESISIFR